MVRRFTNPRIRAVTTRMDVALELLLLAQVVLGCWIALGFRWGSSWFAADLTPYLWSLVDAHPRDGGRLRAAVGHQAPHRGRVRDPVHRPVHAPRPRRRGAAALHRAAVPAGHLELGSEGDSESGYGVGRNPTRSGLSGMPPTQGGRKRQERARVRGPGRPGTRHPSSCVELTGFRPGESIENRWEWSPIE